MFISARLLVDFNRIRNFDIEVPSMGLVRTYVTNKVLVVFDVPFYEALTGRKQSDSCAGKAMEGWCDYLLAPIQAR